MSVVVVGNPKPMSRTRQAAELIVERLTGRRATHVIDVIDLGPKLFGWGDPAVELVNQADVLVVASPTYKATYTGVLKLFLDQFGAGQLRGVTAFPVMLGAGLQHALAPELTLRPVLTEIGCSCPVRGLYLLENGYAEAPELEAWLDVARDFVPSA
jgi:FMN reductase